MVIRCLFVPHLTFKGFIMVITEKCLVEVSEAYKAEFGEILDRLLYKDIMKYYARGIKKGMETGKDISLVGLGKFKPSSHRTRIKNSRSLARMNNNIYLCFKFKTDSKCLFKTKSYVNSDQDLR